MKEEKVYMSKLPKSCVGCKYFAEHRRQCNLELCIEWNEAKFKFNDCPLIDIKTHDRELVEKVLEKTKTFVRENTYICGGNATREDIITSSSYNQALRDVLDFLGALQKELEK